MKPTHRTLGWASLAVQTLAIVVAVEAGDPGAHTPLMLLGIVAFGFAVQSIRSDPKDLGIALYAGVALVVGLLAGRAATWLIPMLVALLFLGAELQAAAWSALGPDDPGGVRVRRLRDSLLLTLAGGLAAAGLFLFRGAPLVPRGGFLVTVLLLAAAGALLFPRLSRSGPERQSISPE